MSGAPTWPRPADEAVDWSRARSSFKPAGRCARHVASAYTDGLRLGQFGIESAIDAWHKATQRVTDGSTPPAGAPVYWSSGKWGHIALSVGGGRVRSTDYPRDTQLGECTLAEMGRRWPGMRYLGWSRDLAGHPIPGLQLQAVTPNRDEDDMPTPEQLWRADIIDSPDKAPSNPTWRPDSYLRETFRLVRTVRAELGALRSVVVELAKGQPLTAEQITAAAKAGAGQALDERIADVDVDLVVTPPA